MPKSRHEILETLIGFWLIHLITNRRQGDYSEGNQKLSSAKLILDARYWALLIFLF